MKKSIQSILLFGVGLFMFACSNDAEPYVYGPDYEIKEVKLEVYNGNYWKDTIPADVFKLQLLFLSDNNYAHDYGINPKLKSNITDLQVIMENYEDIDLLTHSNVSDYFLVNDDVNYDSLYETIEQYTQKKQLTSLRPRLLFTNQTTLSAGSTKLIQDTVAADLKVIVTLENESTFTNQIKVILIP